jgi:hypothetical protein
MSSNRDMNWKEFGKGVFISHREFHSKETKMTEEERLEGIYRFFVRILDKVWEDNQPAIMKYISDRETTDEHLQVVQNEMVKEITQMLGIIPKPGSSFTAGTNLIGESDLDFNIPVPNMDERTRLILAAKCGNYGYKFEDIRNEDSPGVNYVFSKWVENQDLKNAGIGKVEIEVKLNHADHYMKVMDKVHEYLDHRMPREHKYTIAWIKSNFKKLSKLPKNVTVKNKLSNHSPNASAKRRNAEEYGKHYKTFKSLYYEHALFPMGLKEMMYPLV